MPLRKDMIENHLYIHAKWLKKTLNRYVITNTWFIKITWLLRCFL